MNGARQRPFPYPYRAALTVLSDRHGIHDADQFLEMHRFLNTTGATRFGEGVGLDIGDTFWFYDNRRNFSYFDGYSRTPSAQAGLIREFIAAGLIDCLHTYGDFTDHYFERKYAEWAAEECERAGVRTPIWINHGNEKNTQNLNQGIPHHQGANRNSDVYHMDIALAMGVRYLWRRLTRFVGQDRELSLREFTSPRLNGVAGGASFALRRLAKKGIMKADQKLGGRLGYHRRFAHNALCEPVILDDGSVVYDFVRFNNHPESAWYGAYADDIPRQLAPSVLDHVTRMGGYTIIYTHLDEGLFDQPEVLASFRRLAERYQAGDIWVATTATLLDYNRVHRSLQWRMNKKDDGDLEVAIDSDCQDPVFGRVRLTEDDLSGLSFELPAGADVTVTLDTRRIQAGLNVSHEGANQVVTIPVQRPEFPV